MKKILYCIKCERMVITEDNGIFGHVVEIPATRDQPAEIDFCEFPHGWATCPPPALEEGWEDHVKEPEED